MNARKGKGRFTSPIYAQWQWAAAHALSTQKPTTSIRGPFKFRLILPQAMRGDVDNRIKPALDFCVAHAVCPDDRKAQLVSAERGDVKEGRCVIEIQGVAI